MREALWIVPPAGNHHLREGHGFPLQLPDRLFPVLDPVLLRPVSVGQYACVQFAEDPIVVADHHEPFLAVGGGEDAVPVREDESDKRAYADFSPKGRSGGEARGCPGHFEGKCSAKNKTSREVSMASKVEG